MKRALAGIFFVFLLSGCKFRSGQDKIDNFLFHYLGWTLFSNPEECAVRQMLLDPSSYLDKKLLVSGTIVEIGDRGTFLVIEEEKSSLVVVVTDLNKQGFKVGKQIKILGFLEMLKRRFVVFRAKALVGV